MNRIFIIPALSLLFVLFACEKTPIPEPIQEQTEISTERRSNSRERVVVANRASGDFSVINAKNNQLIGTYPMPNGGEPMYVVHIPQARAFFIGDRANNQVVAFDEDDFSVKGTVPAGAGVFHMWASPMGNRLWINNDIDNTTTVINPVSMQVRATVPTPADLVAMGGKPHDVFVDPSGRYAYVSVLGLSGPNDYIVKYDAHQFREVGRVAVGKDPHLFADDINKMLYVPCQNSNGIYVVNRLTMQVRTIIPFNGAHGIFMPDNGRFVYAADISGAGLGVFSTSNNMQIGTAVSTPFPTPHNLSINARGNKLFVTHSGGTADKLTIYRLTPGPTFVTSITVGTNPFGLGYYRY